MCDYCDKMESLHWDDRGIIREVYIEADASLTVNIDSYDDDDDDSCNISINFCPMCGERLVKSE